MRNPNKNWRRRESLWSEGTSVDLVFLAVLTISWQYLMCVGEGLGEKRKKTKVLWPIIERQL